MANRQNDGYTLTLRGLAAEIDVDHRQLSREMEKYPGFPSRVVDGKTRYSDAAAREWRAFAIRQRKNRDAAPAPATEDQQIVDAAAFIRDIKGEEAKSTNLDDWDNWPFAAGKWLPPETVRQMKAEDFEALASVMNDALFSLAETVANSKGAPLRGSAPVSYYDDILQTLWGGQLYEAFRVACVAWAAGRFGDKPEPARKKSKTANRKAANR